MIRDDKIISIKYRDGMILTKHNDGSNIFTVP